MKLILTFVLLCCALISSNCGEIVSVALSLIIKEFYIKRLEAFDVIVYTSEESGKLQEIKEIVNEALKLNKVFPYQVIFESDSSEEIPLDRSALLLFDNPENYLYFHERSFLNNFSYKNFYFLVYILDIKWTRLRNTLQVIMNSGIEMFRFETFMVHNNENSLYLVTFEEFQQPHCRRWKTSIVNQFEENTKKWKNRQIFIDKYFDFDGCELVAAVDFRNEPSVDVKFDNSRKLKKMSGYGVTMHKEISKLLNYSLIINLYNSQTGTFYYKMDSYDFIIRSDSIRAQNTDDLMMKMMFTQSFMTLNQIIVIPTSQRYSQFEKLFLPFELDVWMWLSVTYATAVITILVFSFFPKKVQDYVFGINVKTPILNLM